METTKPRNPALRDAASDFLSALEARRRVHDHPYRALAAAVGVGYVLGGGLFTRLTARLLTVGTRVGAELATVPLLVKAADSLTAAKRPRGQSQS